MMGKFLDRLGLPESPREKATDIYILLMLLIFPVFTGFSGYAAITISKFLFFVTTSLLWLATILVLSIVYNARLSRPSFCQSCIIAYMAICCISALLSEYKAESLLGAGRFDGLLSTLLYCAVFLGVSSFGHFRKLYAVAFGVSISFCCCIAALQLLGFDPLWLFPGDYCYYDAHIRFSSEFLGTIGNVNVLSAVLCLSIPLFACLTVKGTKLSSYLNLIPLFLSSFILIASGVAGGVLAILVCAVVAFPILLIDIESLKRALKVSAVMAFAGAAAFALDAEYSIGDLHISFAFSGRTLLCIIAGAFSLALSFIPVNHEFSRKTMRRFFTVLSVILIIGMLLTAYFWPDDSGTMYELSQLLRGNIDNSFGSSRILIWKETLKLIPENPFFGGGPGTIALRLDIQFSRFIEETGQTLSSYVDNAHNEFLGILADTGILGLCVYLAALASAFIKQLKKLFTTQRCALGFAVFCYCVQSFFGLGLCLVAPLFWVFLGLFESQ